MEISSQPHSPTAWPVRKETPVPTKQEAGCGPKVDGCCGEEKNLLLLLGIKPQFIGCPAHSLVTTQIVLSLLHEIIAGN